MATRTKEAWPKREDKGIWTCCGDTQRGMGMVRGWFKYRLVASRNLGQLKPSKADSWLLEPEPASFPASVAFLRFAGEDWYRDCDEWKRCLRISTAGRWLVHCLEICTEEEWNANVPRLPERRHAPIRNRASALFAAVLAATSTVIVVIDGLWSCACVRQQQISFQ